MYDRFSYMTSVSINQTNRFIFYSLNTDDINYAIKTLIVCMYVLYVRVLTVRFATSLISESQAMTNLLSEVSAEKKSFDTLVEDSRLQWRETLSRILICK